MIFAITFASTVMVEMFQRYVFKEERFRFKDECENFLSIPRPHVRKIRSRAEDVPLPGLLQAPQLGGRRRGLLTLSSLGPGHWPENLRIPQMPTQCWCN